MGSSSWRRHLPHFDSVLKCREERRATANSLRWLGLDHKPMRRCSATRPCRSGLCAVCVRRLRMRLLDFLAGEHLNDLQWHFVTIRVAGWKMAPGDNRPFGRLREHRLIENLTTKLRRLKKPRLMVFGSIETVYNVVANVPDGKPFHLHLMASGVSEAEIDEAVRATIPLSADIVPLDIRTVEATDADFFEAASYAFKQPLMKRSKMRPEDRGALQRPKAAERRELISNVGVHGWLGRLILIGIRCDRGQFRLLPNLSVTATSAKILRLRKLPRRRLGRLPRGQGS